MRGGLRFVLTTLFLSAATLSAQASPYLPLGHPAYAYVDALIERGHLRALWRLERPYRVRELQQAVAGDSNAAEPATITSWRRALAAALSRAPVAENDDGQLRAAFIVEPFITAETSGQRELMLADTISGVYPGLSGTASLHTHHLVILGRLAFDRRLRFDPDYAGKKDRSLIGRNVEGYASAQWTHGELFFGRTGRTWGPPHLRGLQLGDAPYGYEHLYGRLGSSRVRISTLLAKLDDNRVGFDSVATRYFAAHRLALRVLGIEVAGTESIVFGGVGRGLELAYANPLSVYHITQYNESQQGNIHVGLEASARAGRLGIIAVQGMLDDLQIDDCGLSCEEPPSYGVTATWDGIPIVAGHTLFGSYTRLTNLAYRTPATFETYDFLGVALGHAFTDYDELRVGAELAVLPAMVLRAYLAKRRQGEGGFREPFPAPAAYASTPTFLAGTVMSTTRIGATARGVMIGSLAVDADVGLNRTRNAGHRPGGDDSSFEGRLSVRYATPALRW